MDPLEKLRLADPDFYIWARERLGSIELPPGALDLLIEEAIWGLSQEKGLALALFGSLIAIIPKANETIIKAYISQVHLASSIGTTLARILASHLGPALLAGPAFSDKFQDVIAIMQQKGTYTLNAPLEMVSELLARNQRSAAKAYLDLLEAVFKQPMSYNQCQRLVYVIPKAVKRFPPQRRTAQTDQLTRIANTRLTLIDAYLEGIEKGLGLLPKQNLIHFVDQAMAKYHQDDRAGANFLSLTSKLGQDTCSALQVYAPFGLVRQRLNRYLSARLEGPYHVQPLTALGYGNQDPKTWICSNGRDIFTRDEIRHFDSYQRNIDLYLTLVRLEAGFLECESFSFNLDRAAAHYPSVRRWIQINSDGSPAEWQPDQYEPCDAQRFFKIFNPPQFTEDLFLILELARIFHWMAAHYPGLHRRLLPELKNELDRMRDAGRTDHPLMPAYMMLVHGQDPVGQAKASHQTTFQLLNHLFKTSLDDQKSPVEVCAHILCRFFETSGKEALNLAHDYQPIELPFGIRLQWDIFNAALKTYGEKARRIQQRLTEIKLAVNQSDLQYKLLKRQGRLDTGDIKTLILADQRGSSLEAVRVAFSEADLEALADVVAPENQTANPNHEDAFFYPEWDHQLKDYLQGFARVQETRLPTAGSDEFYQEALSRHRGLVTHIRRAFEYLRPEGLAMLRQFPEGDAFDYRALLDFMVDRRAGRIPSDRLYIKRLKQHREVAVLVLVDLSRSTANAVAGKQTSVLNLTQEALILFCEALEVVGDTYALAGFSGTGRHSVDYFRIKDFQEPFSQNIRIRISALTPQRSTRMGAAIRHAARQLADVIARVRLMIIISDGFPNDLGYKGDYAIADTRKAVQEARYRALFVKAVTVNIGQDPRLDDLYGRSHSYVIEDVNGLPEKLLRLYSSLTRPA